MGAIAALARAVFASDSIADADALHACKEKTRIGLGWRTQQFPSSTSVALCVWCAFGRAYDAPCFFRGGRLGTEYCRLDEILFAEASSMFSSPSMLVYLSCLLAEACACVQPPKHACIPFNFGSIRKETGCQKVVVIVINFHERVSSHGKVECSVSLPLCGLLGCYAAASLCALPG